MYLYRDVVPIDTYYSDQINRVLEFNALSNAFEIAVRDTNDTLIVLQTAWQYMCIFCCVIVTILSILEVQIYNLRKRVTVLEIQNPLMKPLLEV
jgi:hypothetical protein